MGLLEELSTLFLLSINVDIKVGCRYFLVENMRIFSRFIKGIGVMKIKKIQAKNFRLLNDTEIQFDDDITIIVGRNNCGKTSLVELFLKLTDLKATSSTEDNKQVLSVSPRRSFKFEDFSLQSLPNFQKAFDIWKALKTEQNPDKKLELEDTIQLTLPTIELTLFMEYQKDEVISSLIPFIADLNPERQDATVKFEYRCSKYDALFSAFQDQEKEDSLLKFIKSNFKRHYKLSLYVIDKLDETYKADVEWKNLANLLLAEFVHAQRHLADNDKKSNQDLGSVFESFYENHKDDDTEDKLQDTLNESSEAINLTYDEFFDDFLGNLKTFGYPSLNDQDLKIIAEFNAKSVLQGNTKLVYDHKNDNLLPEDYNGLGIKNLIYIILQLRGFFENYSKRDPRPAFHLLFIEEPEVHLHPQMQYAFIKNLRKFIKQQIGWNVQIVITTHSPHIVSESGFKSLRYFHVKGQNLTAKNLETFSAQDSEKKNIEFLKQYLHLNNCEMFFADKIIMIEGTVERLLLNRFIERNDGTDIDNPLLSQYISIIEVGGAYAHKFKGLLEFLNIKTLIITDLDAIDTKNDRKACQVSLEDHIETSNGILKSWLPAKSKITELLKCDDRIKQDGIFRVTYQVSETEKSKCGRSFEEAFLLANANHLSVAEQVEKFEASKGIFSNYTKEEDISEKAFEISQKLAKKKTGFAFDIMLMTDWSVPKYIADGLNWLKEDV